jgi:hypothetical protein
MLLWDLLFLSSPNIFSNVSSGFHVCLSFIWTLLYHILVPFLKCYACLRGFTCVYLSRSCTTFWYRCPFALGSSILLPLYYTTIIRRPDRILLLPPLSIVQHPVLHFHHLCIQGHLIEPHSQYGCSLCLVRYPLSDNRQTRREEEAFGQRKRWSVSQSVNVGWWYSPIVCRKNYIKRTNVWQKQFRLKLIFRWD